MALRLVQNLNDETETENYSVTGDALNTTHRDSRVLLSADEHVVLLYIAAAAPHAGAPKHSATFNGRVFYS